MAAAACDGGLGQIFGNPLPENQYHTTSKSIEISSFTEIFGELHFKESLENSSLPFLPPHPPSPSPSPDIEKPGDDHENIKNPSFQSLLGTQNSSFQDLYATTQSCLKSNKYDFSSMNSESLQTCTEGLGFESSFVDVDESCNPTEKEDHRLKPKKEKTGVIMKHSAAAASETSFGEYRRLNRSFPPPIPSIGRNGKPWVSYKSIRQDGRLLLKEFKNPAQGKEFMHACREDGRLTLHLVHRDEENKDLDANGTAAAAVEEEEEEEEDDII